MIFFFNAKGICANRKLYFLFFFLKKYERKGLILNKTKLQFLMFTLVVFCFKREHDTWKGC